MKFMKKFDSQSVLSELNDRSRTVLRTIVDNYVATGDPTGSRTLSRSDGLVISPASIRNIMADLEDMGLLYSPHISAGRLPTEQGLRLFVDGLLERENLADEDRQSISAQCVARGLSFNDALAEASSTLSNLSACAGLVVSPRGGERLKHIEFVPLGLNQALVVIVAENGMVENRVVSLPPGLPQSSLIEAGRFLSARLKGRSVHEVQNEIAREIKEQRIELDALTARVVEEGLAVQSGQTDDGVLIVRGQNKLLDNVTGLQDLESIRSLFAVLEAKETSLKLMETADHAEGVQIFIGSQTELFGLSGCSMIMAPVNGQDNTIVGAIAVVGPMRLDYGRIIPMVDYTAQVMGKIIGG
jgi:heat-inducible transcriptional repressor